MTEDLLPGSSLSAGASRPGTASSGHENHTSTFQSGIGSTKEHSSQSPAPQDPETLSAAHRAYLKSLTHCLFLTDTPFTQMLRDLLTRIDHFCALISNLGTAQQNLDLEADEGVFDSLANYAADEKEILQNLHKGRSQVENGIKTVIDRLREIDEARLGGGRDPFSISSAPWSAYVPWRGASVDRLLMKLDFHGSSVVTEKDIEG